MYINVKRSYYIVITLIKATFIKIILTYRFSVQDIIMNIKRSIPAALYIR